MCYLYISLFLRVPSSHPQSSAAESRSPLAVLTLLKKLCDHPRLLDPDVDYSSAFPTLALSNLNNKSIAAGAAATDLGLSLSGVSGAGGGGEELLYRAKGGKKSANTAVKSASSSGKSKSSSSSSSSTSGSGMRSSSSSSSSKSGSSKKSNSIGIAGTDCKRDTCTGPESEANADSEADDEEDDGRSFTDRVLIDALESVRNARARALSSGGAANAQVLSEEAEAEAAHDRRYAAVLLTLRDFALSYQNSNNSSSSLVKSDRRNIKCDDPGLASLELLLRADLAAGVVPSCLCLPPSFAIATNQQQQQHKQQASAGMSLLDLSLESSKMRVLVHLFTVLSSRGHRTLVFSRSTKTLDLVQRLASALSLGHERIDGSVPPAEREVRRARFQAPGATTPLFLLTTTAAGVGLNLTAADRVIVVDPSWNPAADAQAVDRCYRLGQRRHVVAYRLITAATVEEVTYRKQAYKHALSVAAVGLGGSGGGRLGGDGGASSAAATGGAAAAGAGGVAGGAFSKEELKEVFAYATPVSSTTLQMLQQLAGDDAAAAAEARLRRQHKGLRFDKKSSSGSSSSDADSNNDDDDGESGREDEDGVINLSPSKSKSKGASSKGARLSRREVDAARAAAMVSGGVECEHFLPLQTATTTSANSSADKTSSCSADVDAGDMLALALSSLALGGSSQSNTSIDTATIADKSDASSSIFSVLGVSDHSLLLKPRSVDVSHLFAGSSATVGKRNAANTGSSGGGASGRGRRRSSGPSAERLITEAATALDAVCDRGVTVSSGDGGGDTRLGRLNFAAGAMMELAEAAADGAGAVFGRGDDAGRKRALVETLFAFVKECAVLEKAKKANKK